MNINAVNIDAMRNVDVRTVDRDSLVDLKNVPINTKLPRYERIADYIKQIGKGDFLHTSCERMQEVTQEISSKICSWQYRADSPCNSDEIISDQDFKPKEPTIMKYNPKEFKSLPEVISKEQFRIACHISKRTALYLLQSGLIPNETTGKKTRCYSIKKKDVIAYLKERENDPNKYQPPENWYARNTTSSKPYIIRHLPSESVTRSQLEDYYQHVLADYSDVVDIDSIINFTGYNRQTVGQWCRKGRLKFIMSSPKYMIPKCFLIEYLCSDWYNKIIRKSKEHLNAIWEVYHNSHNRTPSVGEL